MQNHYQNPYRGDYRSKMRIFAVSLALIAMIGIAVSLISMPGVPA